MQHILMSVITWLVREGFHFHGVEYAEQHR